jgi:predicted amidohydrolase YtcJ
MGITAVVEAGSTLGAVTEVYEAAYEAGELPIRAVVYDGWFRSGDPQGLGDPALIAARLDSLGFTQSGDGMLRVRGAKSSADGGIGSRSAALSVPYLSLPEDPLGGENYGAFRDPEFDYRLAQFREIARRGWEIHTHACGDAAIRQTMDVYKILMDEIRRENSDADLRWSIIHDYLPDEPGNSVLDEMAEYGVIAAINPANLYFEGESFLRNLGPERMARHTPYRSFLDAGIVMASGSDYPNNSPDPWIGIHQMVTRRSQRSPEVYGSEQRIPLMEALKTFTINGAYLTYDDSARGSLTPGKLADFVILDADLPSASEEELLEMGSKVLMTVVGGKPVFVREGFQLM